MMTVLKQKLINLLSLPPFMVRKKLFRGRKGSFGNRAALILTILGLLSGMATYAALTEAPPFGDNPNAVLWLLNINLVIVLLLVMIVAKRILELWMGRKKGAAGSKLHIRLVLIFGILTVIPAILMTIFSAVFLQVGVQSWFNEQVQTAIGESQAVAEAYLEEHKQVIRADALAMANDLDRQASFLISNPEVFEKVMETQSFLRNLSEAIVFDESGRVLAKSGLTFTLEFETIPQYALVQANNGEVTLMTGRNDDRVRALLKLNSLDNTYLYVGRMVDPKVLGHLTDTKEAVQKYQFLENERSNLQLTVTMMFIVIALLLLFAAIWYGLVFARQLISPISRLISATNRVRAGDLTARVPKLDRQDEFDLLGETFNKMTDQIADQRHELVSANRLLDERRRFTETILAGVSSGVMSVSQEGVITLVNASACSILEKDQSDLIDQAVTVLIPELQEAFDMALKYDKKVTQVEIPYERDDGGKRILLVRIAIEVVGHDDHGAIITFDDVTEFLSAQRKAAWADVARRIAHEIKNPLTPIQLSAERLRRKYLQQIKDDPETFEQCTDTIIRHVGDIGHMVNEFSHFARMPEAVMKPCNIEKEVRDLVCMQQQAHADIHFAFETVITDAQDKHISCDGHQIRQSVTNILRNATDAVYARIKKETEDNPVCEPGRIAVFLYPAEDSSALFVSFLDNGTGFPDGIDGYERLLDPYVTYTRKKDGEKGTGLGLSIVRKIMDDHKGEIILGLRKDIKSLLENSFDQPDLDLYTGAIVSIKIPKIGTARLQGTKKTDDTKIDRDRLGIIVEEQKAVS